MLINIILTIYSISNHSRGTVVIFDDLWHHRGFRLGARRGITLCLRLGLGLALGRHVLSYMRSSEGESVEEDGA